MRECRAPWSAGTDRVRLAGLQAPPTLWTVRRRAGVRRVAAALGVQAYRIPRAVRGRKTDDVIDRLRARAGIRVVLRKQQLVFGSAQPGSDRGSLTPLETTDERVDHASAEEVGTLECRQPLGARPFKTLIYGFYRGKMLFVEPMITRAYLLTLPRDSLPLARPNRRSAGRPRSGDRAAASGLRRGSLPAE